MRQEWVWGIAISIGFLLSACEIRANSNSSQTFLQGSTVAVNANATAESNYQATLAVLPSTTPTVTPSPGASACDTANLTANAVSIDATEAITFSIQITNQGPASCKLQGWPQIQIVDQQDEALVLQDIPFCYKCNPPGNPTTTQTSGGQTPKPATATATAQAILQKPVALPAGKSAQLFLVWRNWCPPFPSDGVNLLMTLSGGSGELTIPTDARSGGSCDSPTAGSTLAISQFLP